MFGTANLIRDFMGSRRLVQKNAIVDNLRNREENMYHSLVSIVTLGGLAP